MRITLESTDQLTTMNGCPVRVWRGTTAGGVPFLAFVHMLAVDAAADQGEFERELAEQLPPGRAIDLRHVL